MFSMSCISLYVARHSSPLLIVMNRLPRNVLVYKFVGDLAMTSVTNAVLNFSFNLPQNLNEIGVKARKVNMILNSQNCVAMFICH